MRTCHHCHKDIVYKSKVDNSLRMNFRVIVIDDDLNKIMGKCTFCKNMTPVPLYISKNFRREILVEEKKS